MVDKAKNRTDATNTAERRRNGRTGERRCGSCFPLEGLNLAVLSSPVWLEQM